MKTINRSKRIFAVVSLFLACAVLCALFSFAPSKTAGLEIDEQNGIISLVGGEISQSKVTRFDDAFDVLDGLKNTYGFQSARAEFEKDRILDAAYGRIYKFSQVNSGYNVYGRGLALAVGFDGTVLAISGNYLKDIKTAEPRISEEQAVQAAFKAYEISFAECQGLEIYSLDDTPAQLAYSVIIGGSNLFVSAVSGEVLADIPLEYNLDKSFRTDEYSATLQDHEGVSHNLTIEKSLTGSTYYLADATRNIYICNNAGGTSYNTHNIITNSTGNFTNGMEVSALVNFIKIFDFYADANNIGVSLRGANGTVSETHDVADQYNEISTVIVLHYGVEWTNAGYVSGLANDAREAVIVFGDGKTGALYQPVTALDICGHEYTHAVVKYAGGLTNKAINESIADVMGAVIEGHDLTDDDFWVIGEDAKDVDGKKGIRSISNPAYFGNPSHVNNYNSGEDGHYNSTILSHAQYTMYEALPSHFTKLNIGKLWYSTMSLLPADADFEAFRTVMKKAAQLLGWDSAAISAIETGFNAVGITGEKTLYTYTFYDDDGTILKSKMVEIGTVITAPVVSDKPANAEYSIYMFVSFTGFSTGMTMSAANISFTASYYKVRNKYTYTFYGEDGTTVLKTETVNYGTVITPPAVGPTKPPAGEITYVLSYTGFTEGMILTGNISFVATFLEIRNQYTYTFFDEDGTTVLKTETADSGTEIIAPANPEKAPNGEDAYVFQEFEGFTEGMTLTENITFTAKYETVERTVSYTFYDDDGITVLKTASIKYGAVIAAPTDPEKPATAEYTYTFTGFDGFTAGMTLTENKAFVATYSSVINQYTYTFFDEDGTTVLKIQTADYGAEIIAPANPTKAPNGEYTYSFTGFSGFTAGMTLTENKTFAAIYSAAKNSYTVRFMDGASEIDSVVLEYGQTIVLPEKDPAKSGYTFEGWYLDSEFSIKYTETQISSDISVYAKFEENEKLGGKKSCGTISFDDNSFMLILLVGLCAPALLLAGKRKKKD